MSVSVKICGIQDLAALDAATAGGAAYVGFVFCAPSRHRVTAEDARPLALRVPKSVEAVGLFVDPSDDELLAITNNVPLNIVQLHGRETPERVAEVRALTGLRVMKVIHIAAPEDFARVGAYEIVADMLLFDTKLGAQPTGGTGKAFNWELLKGRSFSRPWMLAGGININNLEEAVAVTGAKIVDLSSGVEDASGRKSPRMIRELLELAVNMHVSG